MKTITTNNVSARKIGANLWEVEPQFTFNKNDGRRRHRHRHRHRSYEKEGFVVSDQLNEQPSDISLPHPTVTPYACAITPRSYTLKTSTHMLKVLNRIWNLEEQHSSNTALIKSLKRDLDISQAQIKTLVEERKSDHQEIDELKRSTHERKKKAVPSSRDELFDIKSSFMQEKKTRILLESLCDEFAKGIRDYEQKMRFLQQNCKNEPDGLILHVSEAWLDERVQMKCDLSGKSSIPDNLCCEIETFLEAKKKQSRGSGVEYDDILENREENRSYGVVAEPSLQLVSRMIDRGPEVTEPSSRRAREGIKANTLMAKLVEARLESQFSKSTTVRR